MGFQFWLKRREWRRMPDRERKGVPEHTSVCSVYSFYVCVCVCVCVCWRIYLYHVCVYCCMCVCVCVCDMCADCCVWYPLAGQYSVILDESHYKDLLNQHVTPPPATVSCFQLFLSSSLSSGGHMPDEQIAPSRVYLLNSDNTEKISIARSAYIGLSNWSNWV